MSDSTTDLILPLLQNIQAQLVDIRVQVTDLGHRVDRLEARMDARFESVELRLGTLEGKFVAFTEMTNARFTLIENAIVDLSARTHVLSTRLARIETIVAPGP